ncbi:B12-binding domain-containing radical SAM protein [Candidatus Thiosymbion oneisti]|uniref:B12-binding domain-containing radical SAM protein n=1 Tax=Candidatus Thiosymbion oneisti TaxID=589554 RepID=UPI000B7FD4FD|nr:radical SAM protein [Candidatus Thiosymbion oneisti]
MKIKFIDPQGNWFGLNTGLAYLAGALIAEGHRVEVIDLNNYLPGRTERLEGLRGANIIGISIKTFTVKEALKLAVSAKKINPDAILVCGGAHISIDGLDFMENNKSFDVAVVGDGEETMAEIASEKSLDQIDGIIFRDGDTIVKNKPRVLRKDLDSLPFPNYLCFDSISEYKIPYPHNLYPIITSRGCPSHCLYCALPLLGEGKWRARSPENIIAELHHMKRTYGLKKFQVLDDNFTLKLSRAKAFCRLLIEEKMSLEWECSSGIRAKFTDRELARLMKKAGVIQVKFGIESLIPEIHRSIGKGETLDDVFRAIHEYSQQGIKVGGYFLIGLPGSNKALDRESIERATRMGLDPAVWSILVPYPGTELYEIVTYEKQYNLLLDWREGLSVGGHQNQINITFDSSDYSAKERIDNFFYAHLRSRTYGYLLDMNDPNFKKAKTLLKLIFIYDLKRFPQHLYYIFKNFIAGMNLHTVRKGF